VDGRQLGFPAGAEVLKELGPRCQAGAADDLREPRPQVLLRVALAGDDVDGARLGALKRFLKVGAQLWKDRHPALALALVVLRLRAGPADPASPPTRVGPGQRRVLGGAAQPAVARQGHDQPPFAVRARFQDAPRVLLRDEALPILVRRPT